MQAPRPMPPHRQDATPTRAQLEIVALICQGKSNKEIAADLRISLSTVKNQVTSAMARTGARNRTHIAVMFGSNGARVRPNEPAAGPRVIE